MNKKSIEKLTIWLVAALVIQFLISKGATLYLQAEQKGASDAERIHIMAQAMEYQEVYFAIFGILVNLVIAAWLYQQSSSKKVLWAALGLFAKWWALPIFAWHHYISKQSENT